MGAPSVVRVGLVSDTHWPRFGRELPAALVEGLRAAEVQRILHMGDLTDPGVLALLAMIAPVVAIAGNNDSPELHARLGRTRIETIAGVRIGMAHGDWPAGRARTVDKAAALFADEDVAVVCFGHSHAPCIERRGDRWLVNPGSPTDKRREKRFSYGLLTIAEGAVTPTLHAFDRDSNPRL
jgi:putative phosphoesterase